ncbi:CBM35 domain-containing protein [Hymenobacter baengnokdamensis]|uniref:CBM35 domain-containing protein n=1 Tax=Hymenobacter baengnokdamensis TaxID=2615203 RepID=UPI001248F577|nr:CBM35 domain-containing protein [Hymenobacter baengnokdamensis]
MVNVSSFFHAVTYKEALTWRAISLRKRFATRPGSNAGNPRVGLLVMCTLLWLLGAATSSWGQGIYQAEDPQVAVLTSASTASAAGIGYAEYITQRGASAVTFTAVSVPETRTYAVDFRYTAARPWVSSLSVYVNNVDVTQALFPSTNSWSAWATTTLVLNLRAGSNTIMVRYDADDTGWINLDYIQVKPDPASAGFKTGAASTAGWFPQEITVDKFTGTAQLYVPLHTVQAGNVTVPLGLAYAAAGVQVDDQGGKVGMNWALTGQVSIHREVRDLPDDRQVLGPNQNRYGWLLYPSTSTAVQATIDAVPNPPAALDAAGCTAGEQTAYQLLTQIGNIPQALAGASPLNLYDSEPDVFSYSLPGHTGKFVFDGQGRARTIPYDPITITVGSIDIGAGISAFTIQTTDGTSYVFNKPETITKKATDVTASPSYFLRDYSLYKFSDTNTALTYISSWQASTITTSAASGKFLT